MYDYKDNLTNEIFCLVIHSRNLVCKIEVMNWITILRDLFIQYELRVYICMKEDCYRDTEVTEKVFREQLKNRVNRRVYRVTRWVTEICYKQGNLF